MPKCNKLIYMGVLIGFLNFPELCAKYCRASLPTNHYLPPCSEDPCTQHFSCQYFTNYI